MKLNKFAFTFLIFITFNLTARAQATGSCLDFDGVNDYDTTGVFFIGNTNLTIEAKVNWNGPNGKDQIIVYNGNSGSTGYGLFVRASTNEIHVLCGGIDIFSTSYTLTTGSWTYLSAVFYSDPGFLTDSVKLYVNGNLFSNINIAFPNFPGLTTDRFSIGGSHVAPNEFYGKVDEVRFWSKPLSLCEIKRYLNCEIPGALSDLKANYHFNQGMAGLSNSGLTTLMDDSGFGNNMNLLNFSLTGPSSNWVAPGAVISGYTTTSPTITATALKDTLCFGGTTKLSGSGGVSYVWSDGVTDNTTFTPSFLGTHNYTLTGTDIFGCTNTTLQPVVTSSNTPTLSIVKNTILSQTLAIPNGETSMPYSPFIYTFTDPLPPNVTLIGIDVVLEGTDQGWRSALGDYSDAYISISNELIGVNKFINDDWLVLSIPEDFKPYAYTKNGIFEKYKYGGINKFQFDFDGRPGWQGFIRNITVTFRYKENENSTITACENNTLTLNAFGAKIINWSGGINNNVPFIIMANTVYTATGTNIFGCMSSISQTVNIDAPIISVNSGSVCLGKSFTITPSGAVSYTYSSGSNIVTPSITTSYSVSGTNSAGCVSKIAISDVLVDSCSSLKIYSGITVNGDGINDFWSIDNINNYPQNHVTIFNRWGNKLFDSKGYDNKTIYWPQNNSNLTSGTYFYVIDLGDNSKPLKGWIELVKN